MNTAISSERAATDLVRAQPTRTRSAADAAETSLPRVASDPYAQLAPRILEHGEPCRASILRVQALGMRSGAGEDMYALLLTLLDGVGSGCPIWIGDSVPG